MFSGLFHSVDTRLNPEPLFSVGVVPSTSPITPPSWIVEPISDRRMTAPTPTPAQINQSSIIDDKRQQSI